LPDPRNPRRYPHQARGPGVTPQGREVPAGRVTEQGGHKLSEEEHCALPIRGCTRAQVRQQSTHALSQGEQHARNSCVKCTVHATAAY
jgi:hypothetical protein